MGGFARVFHGLTPQRLVVLAVLGLVFCVFNWPVVNGYVRGLPVSAIVLRSVPSYIDTAMCVFVAIFAGMAAYNCVRGPVAVRVAVTVIAIGAAVWVVLPFASLVRSDEWRAAMHGGPLGVNWLTKAGLAGLAVAAIVYMTHVDDATLALESEERRRFDLSRTYDEARLHALQAQIEPHFLFNTLANIRRLYEVDRDVGRTTLRQFAGMLAQTLPDIRTQRSTLAREVALSLAYLNVQKIRMGDRLTVMTDIPASLRDAEMPAMMLSTLVENAIKHGLAPLPQGGRVAVSATADGNLLRVEVSDTGRGLYESAGNGVGLANVGTRLAALYGSSGRLELEPNELGGVTASLQVPLTIEPVEPPDEA